jgi:hypothetical protein
MSRRGLRDRWRTIVYCTPTIGDACRVLLLLLSETMTDAGYVSVPRAALADQLNVYPQRITDRVGEAVKANLLQKVGGGYHGVTAQYVAVLPLEGNGSGGTYRASKVTGERLASTVTFLHPKPDTKVTAEPVPNVRVTKARKANYAPTTRHALITSEAIGSRGVRDRHFLDDVGSTDPIGGDGYALTAYPLGRRNHFPGVGEMVTDISNVNQVNPDTAVAS